MTNEEKSEKPINPMTNHITIITDNTGTKAWTVNPLGEKPSLIPTDGRKFLIYEAFNGYIRREWQQAESERKCYEVETTIDKVEVLYFNGHAHTKCTCNKDLVMPQWDGIYKGSCLCGIYWKLYNNKLVSQKLKPQTRYLAEIVDENTVRILKGVK